MRLFLAVTLVLLGLAASPTTQAADLPPLPGEGDGGLSITLDPVAADGLSTAAAPPGLLGCRSVGGDWDRDGENENWNVCSTPTCGCACPVVGTGVVVEAADQERGAWVATSGCQTGFATMSDDAEGGLPVRPFVWTWGLPEIVWS